MKQVGIKREEFKIQNAALWYSCNFLTGSSPKNENFVSRSDLHHSTQSPKQIHPGLRFMGMGAFLCMPG